MICDLRNVGSWKRKARGGTLDIELTLASSLDAGQRAEVEEAAYCLADVTGAEARISFGTGWDPSLKGGWDEGLGETPRR